MDNILIVDDDEQLQFIIKDYLKKQFGNKFQLFFANDGLEAIKALQARKFQLVVTDIKMPRVNGLVLLSYIHTNFAGTACIIMTGYGSSLLRKQIVAGQGQYLEKPFRMPVLASMILRAFRVQGLSGGMLRGVSLSSFLLLIEMEYLSCAAIIHSRDGHKGKIYFVNGVLHNAIYNNKLRGEEAVIHLLRMEDIQIKFKNAPNVQKIKRKIYTDIPALIQKALPT